MNLFYETPFQVRYWRPDRLAYSYGIVFQEHIVDVGDGAYFSIEFVLSMARAHNHDEDDAIIEYCDWKDLSKDFNKK